MLAENDWASDEVKDYAIEKLNKITIHAAYPDKFKDTSGIDLTDCSLLEAEKNITENNIKRNIELIGTKLDPEKWAEFMSVTECNAFYNPSDNSINMIIGMMGEPFYSSDMSVEELYASIGAFWVGHEISHAFDNSGAQFDAEGQYRDWWTEADKEEFNKRVGRMDDYLDTIVAFDDNHFIGTNIDTEMIADMTGLQCALRMASKVEGFDYQKFFIKYAQMNASIDVYSSELSQLTQDAHPLNYSRTNVPVQQFEEFYEAFDVKEGDNMYLAPEDRLIVW
ncbi:MAG: Neutral endopeptidase [Firmicutes bacterium ADurb.Bin354]|nr:MAG: Neutral endopeptidase [Firmicutes bacterium ADurb.Bin354]